MRKWFFLGLLSAIILSLVSFSGYDGVSGDLRKIYSRPQAEWPAPFIDKGVAWTEPGILPESPLEKQKDSLGHIIGLGKALFFDTRLSGSGKISCATCHQPALSWTDARDRSIGHEGAVNKRNSPTIQNVWFYNTLFWDGRSKSLADQAFAPINSETEMHNEMPAVMRNIRGVKGYREMFRLAFGDAEISPDRLTEAIAVFEQTIVSRKSRFDEFLGGDKNALTKPELRGLHLFRTKARCMNCHNGPLFTDNQFHRNGLVIDPDHKKDKGRYLVTHREEDLGKFKTPSLRDVVHTGPWMHDGNYEGLGNILAIYNKGGLGQADPLIRPIMLNKKELNDLKAFLNAISAPPLDFMPPTLPE